MKSFLAAIIAALALASVSAKPARTAAPHTAAVHHGFLWQHYGRDPYASSRDEAMQSRQQAFALLGIPEGAAAEFLLLTDQRGVTTYLADGQHFDAMLSRGGKVERDVTVAFKAPAGFRAVAERWNLSVGDREYTLYLPDGCNNWSVSIGAALPHAVVMTPPVAPIVVPPPKPAGPCPSGWTIIGNAWSLASLPPPLRAQADAFISAAAQRDSGEGRNLSAYQPSDFSRTLGKALREQVRVRAPVNATLQVRYLDRETAQPVRELGTLSLVGGMGRMRLPDDPRAYVVELVWPDSFVDPTASFEGPNARLLRVFPNEWGNYCALNVHGAVR